MKFTPRFGSGRPVPAEYRANFIHLYLDIAWFGVLGGSTLAFVAVYAARLGADAFQIGLLSAGPALVNLAFALPVGGWLQQRPVGSAVFWTAVFHRVFYLLWVPLPLFLMPQAQIWVIVGLTLVMSVPGTALAVGFSALFADAVSIEWRGRVVGIRNALLAVTYTGTSLLCGQILHNLPFPMGYQIVFGIGFLGAAMSSLHLWFVDPRPATAGRPSKSLRALIWPAGVGRRPRVHLPSLKFLRVDVLRSPFGKMTLVLFFLHLTQYLPIPLFPLYWVDHLHLTDQDISLGTAAFYVIVFMGSTRFETLSQRMGNQRLLAIGMMSLAFYPLLLAGSQGLELFLVASVMGGLGSTLLSGALINYLLEKIPEDDRPAHLAWYNLALNAAILLGSLAGPLVAGTLGIALTLVLFGLCRAVAGVVVLRWE